MWKKTITQTAHELKYYTYNAGEGNIIYDLINYGVHALLVNLDYLLHVLNWEVAQAGLSPIIFQGIQMDWAVFVTISIVMLPHQENWYWRHKGTTKTAKNTDSMPLLTSMPLHHIRLRNVVSSRNKVLTNTVIWLFQKRPLFLVIISWKLWSFYCLWYDITNMYHNKVCLVCTYFNKHKIGLQNASSAISSKEQVHVCS